MGFTMQGQVLLEILISFVLYLGMSSKVLAYISLLLFECISLALLLPPTMYYV